MPSPDARGRAFLVDDDDGFGKHLYIIISSQCPKGRVLMVNITTAYNVPEQFSKCFIHPGEHPFIDHRSAIAYSRAKICSYSALEAGIRVGSILERDGISPELLKRIQDGAINNDDLPIECEEYIKYF